MHERRALDAYLDEHSIDAKTFYPRAFKVGLYALRKQDPLGRGGF